tara:strand:+ start:840 stop:2024 length:1185 start_codon:yes stop_codon:yes gene_type:complete
VPFLTLGQQTYVPDDNFEQALINMGYDIGPLDDMVPTANISSVINLFIGASNISDLTGIEDFASLSDLSCWGNQLTTLDLSQNTNLIQLDCSGNPLTNLNITGLTSLLWMYTDFCQLTSLDVSTNISLEELDFEENQISNIDLSNNTALTFLYCTMNQLTSLDLSLNTSLEFLMCGANQLTCLKLGNINQQNMTGFITYNNPCLYCIEVDDPIWATANWTPLGLNIDPIASFSVNCPGNCISSGNSYPSTIDMCQGDSIFLEGSFQTNTGSYYDTLLNINSCDSVVNTNLTIWENTFSYDTLSVAESIVWNGMSLNVSGDYSVTLINLAGCDSIVNLNLTVTTTGISDIADTKRSLIKIIDVLGQEIAYSKNTSLFYIYSDGTVEKRIILEIWN